MDRNQKRAQKNAYGAMRTEVLIALAVIWCAAAGVVGGVDGLSLLGFFPLLMRGLLETAREIME